MLIDNSKCNACYSCVNVCPKECISMSADIQGELHPKVDYTKCISCHLCEKHCPILNPVEKNVVLNVYAAITKDLKQLKFSTSGGIASELAKYIINNNGVVYATVMNELEAVFERISDIEDIKRIAGSKYVHSHMGLRLKEIKQNLKDGITVLVIGMPCHIGAVKRYLNRTYENLYTVDLFCHGSPSAVSLHEGMRLETAQKVKKIAFRNGKDYCLTLNKEDGINLSVPYRTSYWFNGFVEGYLFRECCYHCIYADEKRVGDISLGDFWGLGSCIETKLEISEGVNAVLVNTRQGENLWRAMVNCFNIEEHMLEEVKCFNHPLSEPAPMPKNYKRYKILNKYFGLKVAIIVGYPKKSIFIGMRKIVR